MPLNLGPWDLARARVKENLDLASMIVQKDPWKRKVLTGITIIKCLCSQSLVSQKDIRLLYWATHDIWKIFSWLCFCLFCEVILNKKFRHDVKPRRDHLPNMSIVFGKAQYSSLRAHFLWVLPIGVLFISQCNSWFTKYCPVCEKEIRDKKLSCSTALAEYIENFVENQHNTEYEAYR